MLIHFYLLKRKPLYNSKNDPEVTGPKVSIIKRFHFSVQTTATESQSTVVTGSESELSML